MSHIKEWKKFEDLCISHSIDRALLEQAEARERFETESCCTRKCGYYFMLCPCIRHHTHGKSYEVRKKYIEKTDFLRYCALRTTLIKG
jgi:hypothetical protein